MEKIEYKYYITLAPDGTVLRSFSTAFKQPDEGDTLTGSGTERHYNLDIYNHEMEYNLIYKDGEIRQKTQDEIETDEYIKRKAFQQLQRTDMEIRRGVDDIVSWMWLIIGELSAQNIEIKSKLDDVMKTKLIQREKLRTEIRG